MLKPYDQFISLFCENNVFYFNDDMYNIFPDAKYLEMNWVEIRKEGWNLHNNKKCNVLSIYKNTMFTEEFIKNWNLIPLKFFNNVSAKNCKSCPVSSKILDENPNIVSMMFSVVSPGKIIPPHVNPIKGLIRLHLGLDIPTYSDGNKYNGCYIMVGGVKYHWKNGEAMIFDGSYTHSVKNETPKHRLILMLDIYSPIYFKPVDMINKLMISIISKLPMTKKSSLL